MVVGGIYLLIKPSTPPVNNGNQNQTKEDLIVISKSFIPTLENNYDLVAKIENPNNNQGADIVNYEFDLYDSADQLIGTRTGKTYILPQETKYVIEQRFATEKTIAKIEVKFNDISWKKLSQINDLELRIKNTGYQILEDGSSVLAGAIENKSSYDLDTIEVAGVLLDANNNIIAVGKTSINTVVRNESRGFEIFWPYPIAEQVKSFDAKAYTDVFLIRE